MVPVIITVQIPKNCILYMDKYFSLWYPWFICNNCDACSVGGSIAIFAFCILFLYSTIPSLFLFVIVQT